MHTLGRSRAAVSAPIFRSPFYSHFPFPDSDAIQVQPSWGSQCAQWAVGSCLHVLRTCWGGLVSTLLPHPHDILTHTRHTDMATLTWSVVQFFGPRCLAKLNEFSWPNIIITCSFASRNGVIVSFLKRFRHTHTHTHTHLHAHLHTENRKRLGFRSLF